VAGDAARRPPGNRRCAAAPRYRGRMITTAAAASTCGTETTWPDVAILGIIMAAACVIAWVLFR